MQVSGNMDASSETTMCFRYLSLVLCQVFQFTNDKRKNIKSVPGRTHTRHSRFVLSRSTTVSPPRSPAGLALLWARLHHHQTSLITENAHGGIGLPTVQNMTATSLSLWLIWSYFVLIRPSHIHPLYWTSIVSYGRLRCSAVEVKCCSKQTRTIKIKYISRKSNTTWVHWDVQ